MPGGKLRPSSQFESPKFERSMNRKHSPLG